MPYNQVGKKQLLQLRKKLLHSFHIHAIRKSEQSLYIHRQWHTEWRSRGKTVTKCWEVVVVWMGTVLRSFGQLSGATLAVHKPRALQCSISAIWQSTCAIITLHTMHSSYPALESFAEQRIKNRITDIWMFPFQVWQISVTTRKHCY